jgi:hypothetical protein
MAVFSVLVAAVAAFAATVVLFLAFRKVALWYWKIDLIEEHLAAIRNALEKK